MKNRKQHSLSHMNNLGCEIDAQTFRTELQMEDYIDLSVLPYWQEGDTLVCDGQVRESFSTELHQ